MRWCLDGELTWQYSVMWEESTPWYTQLAVSLLSIPLSCLTIGPDIGLIPSQIPGLLPRFAQEENVIRIESISNSFQVGMYCEGRFSIVQRLPSIAVEIWAVFKHLSSALYVLILTTHFCQYMLIILSSFNPHALITCQTEPPLTKWYPFDRPVFLDQRYSSNTHLQTDLYASDCCLSDHLPLCTIQ